MARQPHKRHGYKLTPAADPLSIRKVPLSKQIWELKFSLKWLVLPGNHPVRWLEPAHVWAAMISFWLQQVLQTYKSFSEWRATWRSQMINKTRDRPLVQVLFESPYKQKLKIAGNIVVLYRSSTKSKFSPSTITEEAPRHGSILQQKLYFDYIIYCN